MYTTSQWKKRKSTAASRRMQPDDSYNPRPSSELRRPKILDYVDSERARKPQTPSETNGLPAFRRCRVCLGSLRTSTPAHLRRSEKSDRASTSRLAVRRRGKGPTCANITRPIRQKEQTTPLLRESKEQASAYSWSYLDCISRLTRSASRKTRSRLPPRILRISPAL
jgi:hypothetical protein